MSPIGPQRTWVSAPHMSACGPKQTWAGALQMSANDAKRTWRDATTLLTRYRVIDEAIPGQLELNEPDTVSRA
jgi:hypothetical protein